MITKRLEILKGFGYSNIEKISRRKNSVRVRKWHITNLSTQLQLRQHLLGHRGSNLP